MNSLSMFEIHAAETERAVKFYGSVFGWRFERVAPDFYQLKTESRIHGVIFKRRGPEPVDGQPLNAWACTLSVADVDRALSAVESAGGRVAVPKFPVPGVGWSAYFKDTEGNIAGVFQTDSKAA